MASFTARCSCAETSFFLLRNAYIFCRLIKKILKYAKDSFLIYRARYGEGYVECSLQRK